MATELETAQKKQKAQENTIKQLKSSADSISEAMIADGRTDKSQRYGARVSILVEEQPPVLAATYAGPSTGGDATTEWVFDTGATHHFSSTNVALTNPKSFHSQCKTAQKGQSLELTKEGTFMGRSDTRASNPMSFNVKQGADFSMPLFSGFKAVKEGYKVVLDSSNSRIVHKATGKTFPLKMTASGWTLTLINEHPSAMLGAVASES